MQKSTVSDFVCATIKGKKNRLFVDFYCFSYQIKSPPQMSAFNAKFSDKIKAIGSIQKRFRSACEIKLIFDLTAKHVDISRSILFYNCWRIRKILVGALMEDLGLVVNYLIKNIEQEETTVTVSEVPAFVEIEWRKISKKRWMIFVRLIKSQ